MKTSINLPGKSNLLSPIIRVSEVTAASFCALRKGLPSQQFGDPRRILLQCIPIAPRSATRRIEGPAHRYDARCVKRVLKFAGVNAFEIRMRANHFGYAKRQWFLHSCGSARRMGRHMHGIKGDHSQDFPSWSARDNMPPIRDCKQ